METDIGIGEGWWNLVERRATLTPERTMVLDDRGRALTFEQFRVTSERVAAGLQALGVAPGDVVSWQLPTVMESIVVTGALSRLGAVQNPIIPILRHAEVTHIVGQTKATWLLTPGVWRNFDYAALAAQVAAEHGCRTLIVDHTTVSGHALALPMGDPSTLPAAPAAVPSDRTMWIYYSSGTTAAPKGARHSDYSVSSASNGFVQVLNADDVMPCPFPITHVGGICLMTAALRLGFRFGLLEVFDPKRSPAAMAEMGATILGSALPFFLAYLEAQREHGAEKLFPNLRFCGAGGAPTPPEMHYQLKRELGGSGILNSWGLTEFPIATYPSHDDPDEVRANTVGKPVKDVTIRIVDGELRLDGPQKLLGYVDASLDAAAFDELGFFRTGDLGEIDDDGNVRVTGRLKDIIIRNAENISALEIEDVLYTHPDIADVAVVGVPDSRTGERACAVVVMKEGTKPLTLTAIAEHCKAAGLATQKIPERVEIATSLPRNAMGKLLKQQIRSELIS